MLSVIIPSYNEPLLKPTVQSILDNAVGEIEVICVLDGNWMTAEIDDPRVVTLHLGENRGMRGAINAGVAIARGEYLMRSDAHCSFAPGFDKVILDTIEDDWIVTPERFFLDTKKWEIMDNPPINFCKLIIRGGKFSAEKWDSKDKEMADAGVMIGETMGMQGSVWFMKKSWWEKVIGELQTEGYGHLIQDSTEMIFKTWKAGGKMMLNRNTWHGHRERTFGRTHSTQRESNPANCEAGYKYAIDVWGEYYNEVIKPRWKI